MLFLTILLFIFTLSPDTRFIECIKNQKNTVLTCTTFAYSKTY